MTRQLDRGLSLLLLTFVVTGPRAAADVLEFAAGGRVELAATIDGDSVRLDIPEGVAIFVRGDFRKIATTPWPERDWPERARQARNGGALARFQAARWALDQGLTTEGLRMLREAHAADQHHQPTARLVAILDHLEAPLPDPDIEAIRHLFRGTLRLARGPHVLLLHQHSDTEAEERVDLLEQVFLGFYLEFAMLGIDLRTPTHRVPSVWLAKRDDYEAYLRSDHAEAFLTTRGYYHPTRRLVVSYDIRDDDNQRVARDAIQSRHSELAELLRRIERMPPGARLALTTIRGVRRALGPDEARAEHQRLRRDLDRQQLLLDLTWRRLDLGTAAHELVHQLVIASGLAPSDYAFPKWLHEGLAMQFEVLRAGRWAGLSGVSDIRLNDWLTIQRDTRLASVMRDDGLRHGYERGPYARAWAWVYYLRNEHPDVWTALLDRLRLPGAPARTPAEQAREALLASNTRSIPEWESDWRRYFVDLVQKLD